VYHVTGHTRRDFSINIAPSSPIRITILLSFTIFVAMAGSDASSRLDPFGEEAVGDDSTASRNFDWSNPADFFDSISPDLPKPTSYPTPDEVRQESRKRATKILADWETLNKIIERHEERIQKRWRQKTKAKRRQILLSAWPKMPKMHRPDFDAFTKGRREESTEAYL
jgi:hypothetical protein